jgi:hypothetical protein
MDAWKPSWMGQPLLAESAPAGAVDGVLMGEDVSVGPDGSLLVVKAGKSRGMRMKLRVLHHLGERYWWAGWAFPCLKNSSMAALKEFMDSVKEDFDSDAYYDGLQMTLFSGTYERQSDSSLTELEFTIGPEYVPSRSTRCGYPEDGDYGEDEQRERQAKAVARLKEFYWPLVPLGCTLYALTLGGGFFSGMACECADGPPAWGFVFPALAITIMIFWMNRFTLMISDTEVEGRPMLRLLKTMKGADDFRIQCVLSFVDAFCRFTRAQFVGYLSHCHDTVEATFEQVVKASPAEGTVTSIYDFVLGGLGISGLAILMFITGPIAIQFSYMLYLRRKLDREIAEAQEKQPGSDMHIIDSIDDLSAMMSWAMMKPVGQVFDLAAFPGSIKDPEEAAFRIWDHVRTQTFVKLANNLPDGVLQMSLQAWFLCLVVHGLDTQSKCMMLMNITLAAAPVIGDSVDLLLKNRRITVVAAAVMLMFLIPGLKRTIGAFWCDSGLLLSDYVGFTCFPDHLIVYGNWTSGTLPG